MFQMKAAEGNLDKCGYNYPSQNMELQQNVASFIYNITMNYTLTLRATYNSYPGSF